MRKVRVAIAGLGGVGKRLAQVLLETRTTYARLYEVDVCLVAVCTSSTGLYHEDGISLEQLHNPESLVHGAAGPRWLQGEVGTPDILFDCGPSDFDREPHPTSLPYYESMLESGKAIIALSKSALVSHGTQLMRTAKQQGGWVGLSGAAGAALPGLDVLRDSVCGCTVTRVETCINATSNFILDTMVRGGSEHPTTLAAAIEIAQSQGFAERDVSRDIGGWDSTAKLVLLTNFGVLFNDANGADDADARSSQWLSVDQVARAGLSEENVNPEAVARWRANSLMPRLVATLEMAHPTTEAGHGRDPVVSGRRSGNVSLREYSAEHPFAGLRGTEKAILITTKEMGEIVVSACGPEPEATVASALKDFHKWLRALK